jgi:hypothetical protein
VRRVKIYVADFYGINQNQIFTNKNQRSQIFRGRFCGIINEIKSNVNKRRMPWLTA